MATRVVTYSVLYPDGSAWGGGELTFRLVRGGDVAGVIYTPGGEVRSVAEADGTGSVTLWASEEATPDGVFECVLPSGERFDFSVPTSAGPFVLSVLRENYAA